MVWRSLEALAREGACDDPSPLPGGDKAAFDAAIKRWRNSLAAEGVHRIGLYLDDAWQLGSALLGAWGAGVEVWLPADCTPGTAGRLRPHVDALFGTLPQSRWVQPSTAADSSLREFPERPVVVFTSGSSGEAQPCKKSLVDLENELRGLEATFGLALNGAWVAGTVGHQHIYGLLFRVLWPLCAGRPSYPTILRYPEELDALAARAPRLALISSPAFLKRLPDTPLMQSLSWVASSGGPLSFDAAQACAKVLGAAPIEVYGSSESGGVAWRRRVVEAEPWLPFNGVQVRVDESSGSLELRSDRIDGGRDWVRLTDRARLDGSGFILLGRSDRIAKIEDKRVSLSAMERALESLPIVREARLVQLSGKRNELGAVLTLADGSAPVGPAKAALVVSLKTALLDSFEAVVLPRRWRVVAVMPQDTQGKSSQAALAALFAAPQQPQLLGEESLPGGGLRLRLRLEPGLQWFEGHFPEGAILPGVVQLHWAISFARERLGIQGAFAGLKQLKFSRPLLPDDEAVLELLPEAGAMGFNYGTERGRHCSGKILWGPNAGH